MKNLSAEVVNVALEAKKEFVDCGITEEKANEMAIHEATSFLHRHHCASLITEHEMAEPGSLEEKRLEGLLDEAWEICERAVKRLLGQPNNVEKRTLVEHLNSCLEL